MNFVGHIQIRIETDPADRTQLRMTTASGDPTLTFEYVFNLYKLCRIWLCIWVSSLIFEIPLTIYRLKEYVKEQLVYIPVPPQAPAPIPPQARPTSPPTPISDPGALLAGLLWVVFPTYHQFTLLCNNVYMARPPLHPWWARWAINSTMRGLAGVNGEIVCNQHSSSIGVLGGCEVLIFFCTILLCLGEVSSFSGESSILFLFFFFLFLPLVL